MHYVYILQSETDPARFYIGLTQTVARRLKEHNDGQSIHTNKYRPWRLKNYIAFDDLQKAERFETYLKSGSARACAKRHF